MTDTRDHSNRQDSATETNTTQYRREFDATDHAPTTALVSAVAGFKGTDIGDLPPIRRSIDPDALNGLLAPGRPSARQVSVRYAGCEARVHSDGVLWLSLAAEAEDAD